MTETLSPTDHGLRVDALAAADPQWLADARRTAWSAYLAAPPIDRAKHFWRYTAPDRVDPDVRVALEPAADFGDLPEDFTDATFETSAGFGEVRDGKLLRTALEPSVANSGVILAELRAAAAEHEALVKPHLFSTRDTCDAVGARYADFTAALFAGGTFVHVPRGVVVEKPLKLVHRVGGDGVLSTRTLITLAESAEATVIVDLDSLGEAGVLLHETIEVVLGPNAKLRVVTVQTLERKAVHVPLIQSRIARDARLETVTVALGGAVVKSLQTAALEGAGASSRVLGLVYGDGRQHVDHNTFQDHVHAHTSSDLDFRTVSAGRARSAYTGCLRIGPEGAGCEAHQSNHNMLLSPKARADSIPELEILTNDVVCSHAATVGPIDPEQLYYCEGRGLDEDTSRRLIVMGFLEPAVALIPADDIREKVRTALEARLEKVRG